MENRIYEAFGPHLVLDGFGARPQAVHDHAAVRAFLTTVPEQIGMTPISPVVVMPTCVGLSGFVIIAESHVVVHTKEEGAVITLDVFSCKSFDIKLTTALFLEKFGPFVKTDSKVFDRGLEFPRDVTVVTNHLQKERRALHGGR